MKAQDQFSLVPNLAFICGALGTIFFTEFMMWPGLILSGLGIYRHVRYGDKATAGLLWSAALVNSLIFRILAIFNHLVCEYVIGTYAAGFATLIDQARSPK